MLIAVQGLLTIFLSLVALPVGAAMILANAVLAFATRGANRRLFAGFAIAGAIAAVLVGLLLVAVPGSGSSELVHLTER